MDKQQALKEWMKNNFPKGCSKVSVLKGSRSFLGGWEACEAQQSPTDAVNVSEIKKAIIDIIDDALDNPSPKYNGFDLTMRQELINRIPKILSLFNPSGAAPQAESLNVETGYKKGLQGWTAFFTIGVQTFYLGDLESKERAKWYKEMLDKAFANLPPAQPTAGLVWVKASAKSPDWVDDKIILRVIDTKRSFNWNDDVTMAGVDVIYIDGEGETPYTNIEWLDETNTQAFTREQIKFAFYGACNMINNLLGEKAVPAHVIGKLINEYMNTNYPETKKP